MLIKRPADIPSSEITDKKIYVDRRQFIRAATAAAAAAAAACGNAEQAPPSASATATEPPAAPPAPPPASAETAPPPAPAGEITESTGASQITADGKLLNVRKSRFSTTETLNSREDITTYNNFYEFGTDKSSPSRYARTLRTAPWSIAVEGECHKPAVYHLEDVLRGETFEERIYRLRCVEAWSMVIPWVGFPLSNFLKKVEPTGNAKFVEFTTLADPEQMPGVRVPALQWPYIEGLRMDEAMHPLAILAIGLYDEVMPKQNGAPIRLVVPWKYGFKSIKSIVRIRLVEKQPLNSWNVAQSSEYGFYSNVNPMVDHPRWSQSHEVRLPGLFRNRATLMFNGYADQVASLYSGMDLRANF